MTLIAFGDDSQSGKYQRLEDDAGSDELDDEDGKESGRSIAGVAQTNFGESSHSETGKYRKLEEDSPSDEEDGDQEGKGDADDETAGSKESLSSALEDHHGNEVIGFEGEDCTKHDAAEDGGFDAANTTGNQTQLLNELSELESRQEDDEDTEDINGIHNPLYQPSCVVGEGSGLLPQEFDVPPQRIDVQDEQLPFLPDRIPVGGDADCFVELNKPDTVDDNSRSKAADESVLSQPILTALQDEFCAVSGDRKDRDEIDSPMDVPNDLPSSTGSNSEECDVVDGVDLINFKPQNWLNTEILERYPVPH